MLAGHALPCTPSGLDSIEQSRRVVLDEIGPAPDLTFIRGYGNIGDELIWAGTRQLLGRHIYREIGIEELSSSSGHTALLCGGGAFSYAYNEFMPEALAIAEMRFERVIVLPSTFEVEVDRVRDALVRSRATFFAREEASFDRIVGLCRARLAHDCAFFFDFTPYSRRGAGTLSAFRTDLESRGHHPPADNNDISATCRTLDEWLATIAQHAIVHTDRAHVMIAAALMGKKVHYASNGYFKVDAIAASCLRRFHVQKLPAMNAEPAFHQPPEPEVVTRTRQRLNALALETPAPPLDQGAAARVTAVILSRNRPATVIAAIDSVLRARAPVKVLVLDQGSDQQTRDSLRAKAEDPRIDIRFANRNLRCAGGRKHAVELVDTDLVLFLDDDAELMPGALEHMIAELDAHPDATAVTPFVVFADGMLYHFGGWVERTSETVRFEIDGYRRPLDEMEQAVSGPTGWIPGTASLIRTAVFDEVALDDRLSYFEDNDWSLRAEARFPASFRRCREAIVMHALPRQRSRTASFIDRAQTVRDLVNHAWFWRTHGVMPDRLDVPELVDVDGRVHVAAARLLLDLVLARGVEWTLMQWMNGGLRPLFDSVRLGEVERTLSSVQRGAIEQQALLQEQLRVVEAQLYETAGALHDSTGHVRDLTGRLDDVTGQHAAVTTRVQELEARSARLDLIENGPWWRLRARLLPIRPAVLALRQLVGQRGPEA